MFGFLKKKLGDALSKFTKKAEEEADVVEVAAEEESEERSAEKQEEEKQEPKADKKKKEKTAEKKEEQKAEPEKEKKAEKVEPEKEKETEQGEGEEKGKAKEKPRKEKKKEKELTEKKETSKETKPKHDQPVEKKAAEEKEQTEQEEKQEEKGKPEPKAEETSKEEISLEEGTDKRFSEEKTSDQEADEEDHLKVKEEKKGFFKRLFGKKQEIPEEAEEEKPEEKAVEETKGPSEEEEKEEPAPLPEKEQPEEPQKKPTIFGKLSEAITKVSLSEEKFDELFWDIELAMLENNVAVEVIEKIKQDLKQDLVTQKINRKKLQEEIISSLKRSIESLFDVEQIDLLARAKEKKPLIIAFIGINGSGKTTSLAKLANMFLENNLKVVAGACDTFRAAAIQQLQEHTDNLGIKLIKQDYGSDPAAVAYDTVQHAKAKDIDVVMIDTAGRLHSNKNLMDELKKLVKVVQPDIKIFVGESIAGNDLVEQVKLFDEDIGIDAVILAKADVDEKGGAAISVSYITGKPILYLGTGQEYNDLERFDKQKVIDAIFS